MIAYYSQAEVSESHPCQVSWIGQDSKPIQVANVTATLFKYQGVVRTVITGPVAMQQTDQDHRFITKITIPNDVEGQTLFVEYVATLVGDESEVKAEQTISVKKAVASSSVNNIISVI